MNVQSVREHFTGNYNQFYSKYLPKVKHIGGDEYIALCPFHDDTKPSFNFNKVKGTYFCHGCGKKGDFIHFYAKLHGLDTRRDFGKILNSIASDFGIPVEKTQAKIISTYDYVDETGNLLFQVCRMDPKEFRQRRPNGKGWIWNLNGTRRVLYRLPEVLKAQEILVVEGEKDVEAARQLGFVATTCPMGAGKWRDEYNQPLRGKKVILIPDNDEQGRKHMMKVAQSLNGSTEELKWIDLPDVPSKGDLSDWVAQFSDLEDAAERLSIMIENADLYEPPKEVTIEDVILDCSSFASIDLPNKEAYLHPWLKSDSINLICGWRGIGKTFFALGLLKAVAFGKEFGPWECKRSVPCLFLDGEMPPQDVQERIKALLVMTTEN